MAYVIKCQKCHFMTFYNICHMNQSVIKYGNMGIKRATLIRRINLRNLGLFNRNNEKTENNPN